MTNKDYDSLVMLKGYNTKLVERAKGMETMFKLDNAYDRMLYCRTRGFDHECNFLYEKITRFMKEIEV